MLDTLARFMGLKNQLLFFLSNKALVRYSVFNLEIGQSGLYVPHGILNSRSFRKWSWSNYNIESLNNSDGHLKAFHIQLPFSLL